MYKYLPSKRFLLIILSIVVALGIIYAFSVIKNNISAPKILSQAETKEKVQEFMTLDSDNDGLKDWEEALFKTDPKNPDTDGDKTLDGEEAKLNRDPLKANTALTGSEPNDKIDTSIINKESQSEGEFSNLTLTDKIGRVLFSQYLATRKIDSSLTSLDQQQIIENTLANLPPVTFKTYSEKDLITTPLSDNETLRNYSNSLAEILIINLETKTENINDIMTDYSNISDDSKIDEQTKIIFNRFGPLVEKNQKTVSSLLKVKVPTIFLVEHLELLNSFQEIYQSLDIMEKSATDIMTIVPILNNYGLSMQKLSTSLSKIVTKVISLNITYKNNTDYGHQLFNVIMLQK